MRQRRLKFFTVGEGKVELNLYVTHKETLAPGIMDWGATVYVADGEVEFSQCDYWVFTFRNLVTIYLAFEEESYICTF